MENSATFHKKLLPLFVPIFLETFFLMLSGMVDTFMLSHVGDAAVGAVGTANSYLGVFFLLFAVMAGVASIMLFCLTPLLKRMMKEEE